MLAMMWKGKKKTKTQEKSHVVMRVDSKFFFRFGSWRTFMLSRGVGTASRLEKNKMQTMP